MKKYSLSHLKVFGVAFRKGKITFKKLFNMMMCHVMYLLRKNRSAVAPTFISLELTNECNVSCLFCRNLQGEIHDWNPASTGEPIPKGKMSFEMFCRIIDSVKDRSMVVVLYTNGEPLMSRDLVEAVRYASDRKMITIIATNGSLLTEQRIIELIDAGIDFVKIQLSGLTPETYNVEIPNGHVEKVKEGIKLFARLNEERGKKTVVLVDFITYTFNRQEIADVQKMCADLSVNLSLRPGNPAFGLEDKEPALYTGSLPIPMSCDWLWKGMQINFNGDILPCCECVVWSGITPYANWTDSSVRLLDIWNGPQAQTTRKTITQKGRGAIPICSRCLRRDISFKW